MRQVYSPKFVVADLLVLVCAAVMLIAFFSMTWLEIPTASFTGGALVSERHDEMREAMQAGLLRSNLASVFLIPFAGLIGGILVLRRLLNDQVKQNVAIGPFIAGLISLSYFVIFLVQNRSIADTTTLLGDGFWVACIASVVLVLQVLIPRPAVTATREKWRTLWYEIKKNRWAYVFISPFFLLFSVFGLFPIVFSMYLSFQRWNGVRPMEFIGLKHYNWLFQSVLGSGSGGRVFWQSVENGFYLFIMYVPLMTFMAIVLAVILNSPRIRGFRFYRTLIFAPYVTSMIAAGFTFRLMLTNDGGLFNLVLDGVGLPTVAWLEEAWWGRASLCMLVIWGWLGYNMVLMLAGLQTIPKELAEAARVDGASPRQVLFRITMPLLRPMILFSVVLSTMGTFALFNEVMALTNGTAGPRRATLTPIVHIYNDAFQNFWFGRASAQGYVYFLLLFVLTIFQFRYIGRGEQQ